MKRKVFWLFPIFIFIATSLRAAVPTVSFKDAYDGLTKDQISRLKAGEVVILDKDQSQGVETEHFIQAALYFSLPVDEVYKLLSNTLAQEKYLGKLYKVTSVEDHGSWNKEDFTAKISFITINYRVQHNFQPDKYYFYWALDPTYKNQLKHLEGYWKLYKIDEKHTVARYGTIVNTSDLIPKSIQEYLTTKDLPDSLGGVKKYIDSDGAWAKPGYIKH